MPSSMVNEGRTLRPELLVTDTVIWSTVASWPVVRTDLMAMASGLGLASAARTARPQDAAAPDTTHFQYRQQAESCGRCVVAAAATAAGISMTR